MKKSNTLLLDWCFLFHDKYFFANLFYLTCGHDWCSCGLINYNVEIHKMHLKCWPIVSPYAGRPWGKNMEGLVVVTVLLGFLVNDRFIPEADSMKDKIL